VKERTRVRLSTVIWRRSNIDETEYEKERKVDPRLDKPTHTEVVIWARSIAQGLACIRAQGYAHGHLSSTSVHVSLSSSHEGILEVDATKGSTNRGDENQGSHETIEEPSENVEVSVRKSRRSSKISSESLVLRAGCYRTVKLGMISDLHYMHCAPKEDSSRKWHPWLAPELCQKDTAIEKCSQEADMYAFGVLLTELYNLRRPWFNENCDDTDSMRRLVLNGKMPPIRESHFNKNLSGGFINMMQRCLRFNPSSRPSPRLVERRFDEILATGPEDKTEIVKGNELGAIKSSDRSYPVYKIKARRGSSLSEIAPSPDCREILK